MNIRSITCFVSPGWPIDEARIQKAGAFAQRAKAAYEAAGYTVQTVRLATEPFCLIRPQSGPKEWLRLAQSLEGVASQAGFQYLSLGPALPSHPQSYAAIPEIIAATETVFLAAQIAMPGRGVDMQAVRESASVIQRLSTQEKNGFANLYFCALAGVQAGAPFFPAAYQEDGAPDSFALALEAADLAVSAFGNARHSEEGRKLLIEAIEWHARRLEEIATHLMVEDGLQFKGLDFTMAPFPRIERSTGQALELGSGLAAGMHGSLASAAFLADTLDRAHFTRTGFNGLMLPVLEDAVLARRAAQGSLTVMDLLAFSAVCGTGLDTVPLPGDTPVDALAGLLLDIAALSVRLHKPLTARLMPIPDKKAGDETGFEFDYFANSRIMALRPGGVGGLLAGGRTLELFPRYGEVGG